ncbi:MAG: N-acetylmuramoyl-L-alanine amidase [Lachnospiraceae bacterium]|nr:N-acetylmuramoyl-L-alanine amidase [Lachnospiraceae bacterium]
MYEGQSFSNKYSEYCEHRKKHKRRLRKLALAAVLFVCVALLALVLSYKILPIEVWATPEKDIEDLEEITELDLRENLEEEEAEEEAPTRINPLIFVDAGHGGNDGGCAEGGIIEKDINLSIALLVRDKLEALGYEVVMSRSTDVYVAKEERVKKANGVQADIYVSIHQNSSDERSVNGMEVWYDGTDTQRDSKRLALLISQQTAQSTGAVEREVRGDADFHVTGSTQMPACLVETGFLTNKKERGKLSSQEYQEQIASGIVQGIDYYFNPKTMYLTFDDGPSEENTPRVLDVLKERNIKATFFLVGESVEKHPEIVRRIAAEGHTIGVHCYNHDYKNLYQSVESYVQDFEHARQVICDVTGVETILFRFPGGSINSYNKEVYKDIIEEMTDRGYIYYDWNASLEDAVVDSDPVQLLANGVGTTLGRKKVILLAHDVIYNTGTILEDLLDRFPEYQMQPLSEDVEPIHF